ncbi:hypothetical protein [Sciscionella sediminilitoris]|uniref:hypothetical protein n=1 Tax=Sciscionella sediminilitoris TaxID=1445613 RepID=UPI0006921A1F|nr:hypothetical protein [Sciscionella sp. SE31]
MTATLAESEARLAALEAERADYRAVLTAVNALGENQREQNTQLRELKRDVPSVKHDLGDTGARVRSIEERLAGVEDLLVRALGRCREVRFPPARRHHPD